MCPGIWIVEFRGRSRRVDTRGWSVAAWATHSRVLVLDDRIAVVAAVRADAHRRCVARSAGARGLGTPATAGGDARPAALDMVGEARGSARRLFVPGRAEWIQTAVAMQDSNRERTIAHMLLPADVATPAHHP